MPGGHRGDVEVVSSPASDGASHERMVGARNRWKCYLALAVFRFTVRIILILLHSHSHSTLPMHFDGWAEMLNDCRLRLRSTITQLDI